MDRCHHRAISPIRKSIVSSIPASSACHLALRPTHRRTCSQFVCGPSIWHGSVGRELRRRLDRGQKSLSNSQMRTVGDRAEPQTCASLFCRMIRDDTFGFAEYFKPVVDSITGPDTYLLANDFDSYLAAQVSAASSLKNVLQHLRILDCSSLDNFEAHDCLQLSRLCTHAIHSSISESAELCSC
jgi:hypothetical protein